MNFIHILYPFPKTRLFIPYLSMHKKEKVREVGKKHMLFFSVPTPTQSGLPFCTWVQFSCDSILAFND